MGPTGWDRVRECPVIQSTLAERSRKQKPSQNTINYTRDPTTCTRCDSLVLKSIVREIVVLQLINI
jgi:hypothetical protein